MKADREPQQNGRLSDSALHGRLGLFYFAFYAVLGAFLPYWALWILDQGFDAWAVGLVFGSLALSRIVVPVLWGWLADHTGRRIQIVRWASLAAAFCFAAMALAPSLHWMLLGLLAYAVFWHACLPLFETVALDHIARTGIAYTRVRLWGSVGFVLTVVLLGWLLQSHGIAWLPLLIVLMMLLMGLAAWFTPAPTRAAVPAVAGQNLKGTLRQPAVLALLAICFLSQLSFAPYYGFFSVYLEDAGYSHAAIGALWAWGVVAEIIVFLRTGQLLARFGARWIMIAAMLSTALRWGALPASVDSAVALLLLQTLHFASFGLYHAAAITLIQRHFPGGLRARGQALYSAVSFGLGGALGGYLSGWLWLRIDPDGVYWLAGVAGAVGILIAYALPRDRSSVAARQ